MEFQQTAIPDVIVVRPRVFSDDRGFFQEFWHSEEFAQGGIKHQFVQDNHSRSGQGVLRGLHYQIHSPQGKLVRVVAGEIFDVALDLRKRAVTFGQWVGTTLSEQNKQMLWIPPGFAHGFLVLSQLADVIYKCTDFYAPGHERTIRWDDPDLAIDWPPLAAPFLFSEKDAAGSLFQDADVFEEELRVQWAQE